MKHTIVNTVATGLATLIQFGISFFLTPYIVHTIGATAYGFIGLVNTIIGYSGIITIALNTMAGRFITIEYNRGNLHKANVYFKSVLISSAVLAVVFLIPGVLFSLHPEWIMNIPQNLLQDVRITFFFSMLSTEIALLLSVYGCVYFVRNRLDKSALRNIESNILRAIILIALFALLQPKIYYLTATMLVVTLYTAAANIYYTRKLTPELSMRNARFSGAAVRELVSAGVWKSVDSLSYTLLISLSLYMVNLFLGPALAGQFSLANTIKIMITSVMWSLTGALTPQFFHLYARGEQKELVSWITNTIRLATAVYCIGIGFLIVFGQDFFALWVPSQDSAFLQAMSVGILVPTVFSVGSNIVNQVYITLNKLKIPSIAFFIFGALNVSISLVLLHTTHWGIWVIIGVMGVLDAIKNAIWVPWYAAHCLGISYSKFARSIFVSLLCIVPVLAISFGYRMLFPVHSWIGFITAGVVCCAASAAVLFALAVPKPLRTEIISRASSVLLGGSKGGHSHG